MGRLSSRRKESSTAFLTHWLVTHLPPVLSAQRRVPASRPAMTSSTASRRARGALAGLIEARPSQASSIVFCALIASWRTAWSARSPRRIRRAERRAPCVHGFCPDCVLALRARGSCRAGRGHYIHAVTGARTRRRRSAWIARGRNRRPAFRLRVVFLSKEEPRGI